MSKLSDFGERTLEQALELVGHAGDGLRSAGHSLREHIPSRASAAARAGLALGAVKTGARATGKFAKRNPVLVGTAAAAVVALAGYAVYRKYKQRQASAPIEGSARRLEPAATRGNAGTRRVRSAARARVPAGDTSED